MSVQHYNGSFAIVFFYSLYLGSLVLDENGVLYSFGAGLCGALGHGDMEKQEYPMMIKAFGESCLCNCDVAT